MANTFILATFELLNGRRNILLIVCLKDKNVELKWPYHFSRLEFLSTIVLHPLNKI